MAGLRRMFQRTAFFKWLWILVFDPQRDPQTRNRRHGLSVAAVMLSA